MHCVTNGINARLKFILTKDTLHRVYQYGRKTTFTVTKNSVVIPK